MNTIRLKLRSKALMGPAQVTVLLPSPGPGEAAEDFYASGRRYRVLWLLHGAGGDDETFLLENGIEPLLRGKDIMAVMPAGLNSDYANHMEFAGGYAFTDYFFDELMLYIHSTLPASAAPEDNLLAGYSMGGAGALLLGLKHPERFAVVAPLGASFRESSFLQPYLELSGEAFRALALADPTRFPTEYGDPKGGITRKEINMIARYPSVRDYVNSEECTIERFTERAKNGTLPRLLFCCGEKDPACEKVEAFRRYAESLGVTGITYDYLPGVDHGGQALVLRRALELLEL